MLVLHWNGSEGDIKVSAGKVQLSLVLNWGNLTKACWFSCWSQHRLSQGPADDVPGGPVGVPSPRWVSTPLTT